MENDSVRAKPWALITGASSGIGLEIARKLDSEGYCTILVARRRDRLEELQAQLVNESKICVADLSKSEDLKSIYTLCQEGSIFVDVLVNNAGFGYNGAFNEEPLEVTQDMIRVNIVALVTLTKLFLTQMIEQGCGHIVQISSAASFFAGPLMANYYATKAYVTSFSRALAYELKPYGIAVTAICPGPVHTEFGRVAKAGSSRMLKNKVTTAAEIARFTWQAMQKKQVVAVHGGTLSFLVGLSRFLPSSLVIRLTALLNKTKSKIE